MKMLKISFLSVVSAAALVACGGGGGSGGESHGPYNITVSADKTQLPLNIANTPVGIGVYSPFTTTVYVRASELGRPIPGGEEIFGCNVSGGLNSGVLYYLDGDDEHEDEDGNPLAYRSITLDSNSGGNSFHFHAGNEAGTSTITCSVTDPRDKKVYSSSVSITVGGATGRAASIQGIAAYPTLGTQGNGNNIRTSMAIEAHVLDDANQPVPSSGKPNLQIAIVPGGAAAGSKLLTNSQSSNVALVSTINGVGLFSLASGLSEGTILLEMTADRHDNDVTNGIQDPITQLLAVPVTAGNTTGPAPDPLLPAQAEPPTATNGLPYSFAFSVSGGVAPYMWSALGALPPGLSLSSSGILAGTPNVVRPGDFPLALRVTDSRGSQATVNTSLTVDATPTTDPETTPLTINLSGCGADLNGPACALPDAKRGESYQYVLTASGGGNGDATWAIAGGVPPTGLALLPNGILLGTVPAATTCGNTDPFFVRATKGGSSATRKVIIRVVSGAGAACP